MPMPDDDSLDYAEEEGEEGTKVRPSADPDTTEEHPEEHSEDAPPLVQTPELAPEIEEAIKKVEVAEEPEAVPGKVRSHIIPQELIDKPLGPEDLWEDDGTI